MSSLRVAQTAVCLALSSAPFATAQAQYARATPITARAEEPLAATDSAAAARKRHTLQNAAWATGYGVVAFGIIWVLPEDISKWPKDVRKLNHRLDALGVRPCGTTIPGSGITPPILCSAPTATSPNNHGESRLQGFLYSTATSIGWEYGVEAWVEHPGAPDLLITSTAGSVLGELSYQATRKLAADGFRSWEKAVLVVIDPIWIAQRGFSMKIPGPNATT